MADNAPVIGLAIWTPDGESVAKHVTWQANDRALGMTEDEYIDYYVRPSFRALEKATGQKLFPDLTKPRIQ